MITSNIDEQTRRWIRNRSDELAAQNGCYFDVERGVYAVWWIERYCKLYEGEWAGENVLLRSGCPAVDKQVLDDWEHGGREESIARLRRYEQWVAAGNSCDWQYECTTRLFGWARWSERWQRNIRRFTSASIWIPKKQKKMNHPDDMVPVPGGWTRFGDLRVGDELFDRHGGRCRVVCEHLPVTDPEWYEVEFTNGERIRCNGEHLWYTETLVVPKQHHAKGANAANGGAVTTKVNKSYRCGVWSTKEISETLTNAQGALAHRVPVHDGLVCEPADLPVDPYWLGLWLGDGTTADGTFTAVKEDGEEYNKLLKDRGCKYQLRFRERDQCQTRWHVDGGWHRDMRLLGFKNNKHIPAQYLRASLGQRLDLLRGLMDTDGCVSKKYAGRSTQQCVFSTKLHCVANSVCELLATLGVKFTRAIEYRDISDGDRRGYHRIVFSPVRHLVPFALPRKVALYPTKFTARSSARSRHVHIKHVRPIPPVESRCITVDSNDGTYLIGRTMLPTHNSPSLAALGVHLICGDGEQGSKCFGGAKDGNQAGIAMAHAIAMVEQSPELAAECKINRNEKSIEHIPTRSKYKPLSSANERTKTSKEGINGHILIDETHVVDRDFIKIISRAGISRAEPLHVEVSTAGNNPDGYGKERQDYARQVITGATRNDQLFVAIYEAPQDLTDEQLAEDPVKYGKMANPAWGHTAHEEEYLADYNESKRTISGLADFKMYRLNIWQHTANQWLRLDDWVRCASELRIEDYAGETASAGLDLSKTQDMSALSIAIPGSGGMVDLYARLWCTEAFVRDNADKADFLAWQHSGHLIVIPGDTIQEQYIRDEITAMMELLDLRILVKDRAFAADLADWCEDKYPKLLQVDYPQNAAMMEKPIDDFEAAVIEGNIRHENNACLNWQAGHASTRSNARGYRIIQKPKRGDYRKVDGMVSSVMAYWGVKHLPKKSSVYRRRGVLTA